MDANFTFSNSTNLRVVLNAENRHTLKLRQSINDTVKLSDRVNCGPT